MFIVMMGITSDDIIQIIEKKLAPFEESLQFLDVKYESMIKKVAALEAENQSLRLENNALKSQVNTISNVCKQLEAKVGDEEQYFRRECVGIKGILVDKDKNT